MNINNYRKIIAPLLQRKEEELRGYKMFIVVIAAVYYHSHLKVMKKAEVLLSSI